jgi:hypothetical protein
LFLYSTGVHAALFARSFITPERLLPLALFVTRIDANDPHHALATNDLAIFTYAFD